MKEYVQLARIRGNIESENKMLTDDFYTLLQKNSENNKGIRKFDRFIMYKFENKIQQNNFIEYLKTDFARFCLSIYKNKSDVDCGELNLIPHLEFNESWSDTKLYKKFNISPELQDYITNFLPDYHGVRK